MRLQNPRPIPLDEAAIREDAAAVQRAIHETALEEARVRKSDGVSPDWPMSASRLPVFRVELTAQAITGDRRIEKTVVQGIITRAKEGDRRVILGGAAGIWRGTKEKAVKPEGRVTVRISDRWSPAELAALSRDQYSPAFSQALRVLRHELTHVGDHDIEKGEGPTYQSDAVQRGEDWKGYYNDPLEVRAFAREIADDVVHFTNLNAYGLRPGSLFDRALESSEQWERMQHHLSPENQRKILKVAYRAVQDARGPAIERQRKIVAMQERMRELTAAGRRENPVRSGLEQKLLSLRPAMAIAAQGVLDDWEQDDEGVCEDLGTGGVCDRVADALATIITLDGTVETTEGGQEGDDHAYVIAYDDDEAFLVDIPPGVYESGSGYCWKKRKGVVLTEDDVVVERVNRADMDDDGRRDNPVPPEWRLHYPNGLLADIEKAEKKLGVEVAERGAFGQGGEGIAYPLKDGRVLKVTRDPKEIDLVKAAIRDAVFDGFVRVTAGPVKVGQRWAYAREPITPFFQEGAAEDEREIDIDDGLNMLSVKNDSAYRAAVRDVSDLVPAISAFLGRLDTSQGLSVGDVAGNVGWRSDGTVVLFDGRAWPIGPARRENPAKREKPRAALYTSEDVATHRCRYSTWAPARRPVCVQQFLQSYGQMPWRLEHVPLRDLWHDPDIDQEESTAAYAERIRSGQLPPAVVIVRSRKHPGRLVVIDGNHRVAAAKRAGLQTIEAFVQVVVDDRRENPTHIPAPPLGRGRASSVIAEAKAEHGDRWEHHVEPLLWPAERVYLLTRARDEQKHWIDVLIEEQGPRQNPVPLLAVFAAVPVTPVVAAAAARKRRPR